MPMKFLKVQIVLWLIFFASNIQAQADLESNQEVYLVGELSKTSIGVGDAVEVTYKLYVSHNIGIENWKDFSIPDFVGFESELIDSGPMQVQYGKYRGKNYRYVLLSKSKLIATKSGVFQFEAAKISITMQVATGEDLGSNKSFMKELAKDLKSEQMTITVK